MNFLQTIKNAGSAVKISVSKHSPEILVGAGLISLIGAGILACKKTVDAADILEYYKDNQDEEHAKRDCAINLVKCYALPAGVAVLGTTSILCGFGILKKRYVASVAAYDMLQKGYDIYRDRIRTKFGEEADRYGLYGEETIEVKEKDENGKSVNVKKKVITDNRGLSSPFARIFAPYDIEHKTGSKYYENDVIYNESTLSIIESGFVSRYENGEPIFLNDVYKALGFDIDMSNDAGQRMGWWKGHEPAGSDGIFNLRITRVINKPDPGYGEDVENVVWIIDPNVPGCIV